MNIFAEPFSWLKPVGDFLGSAQKAVQPLNDWNALGSIGWKAGGPLGQITYNAPNNEQIEQRQAASNPTQRVDPTDNIARILGINGANDDPYPSHGYTTSGNPGRQGNDETIDTGAAGYQSESEIRAQKIMDLLEQLQAEGPGNDSQALVDEAFAGSFKAIEDARARAQGNFNESDKAIQGLTAGHVNEIKTNDRAAVNQNANELTSAYDQSFKQGKDQLTADRNAELSARAEMLNRLGIQEAGLGDTGSEQTAAITRMTEDQGAAKKQAEGYRAADLTRNTELASSVANSGVERRGDLRRQLDGIYADLDQSKATVENSRAQARLSGRNADKADFLKQMEFYSNELADINKAEAEKEQTQYDRSIDARDFAAKQSSAGGGGVLDVAARKINNLGYDATPYKNLYAQVMSENGYDSRSGNDKVAYMQSAMIKKAKEQGINLDPNVALDYVMTIENYGTDKVNAPI